MYRRAFPFTLILAILSAVYLAGAPAQSAPSAPPRAGSPAPSPSASPSSVAPQFPFVPLWVGKRDTLTDAEIKTTLDALAASEPDPQQVFVLFHGWMNSRELSEKSYIPTAQTIRALCRARNQRVGIVGFQWDSYVGKSNTFVPQFVASMLGLAKNPYVDKARLSRKIGRRGARQLVLAIHDRFPKARVQVLAHSMGCELAGHMLGPTMHAHQDPKPPFEPERPLGLDLLCLAGSDLDNNAIYQSKVGQSLSAAEAEQRLPRLIWITVPKLFQGLKDDVLALHDIARGQAAMGNAVPKMKEAQLDILIGGQRLYYDNEAIPPKHDWPLYYTPERLTRLMEAVVHLQDPGAPSRDLQTLEQMKALPDDPATLSRHFDDASMGVRLYLIWRLERILCGGPHHLADGSIASLASLMYKNPNKAEKKTRNHPCKVISQGFLPTPSMWAAARAFATSKD